MIKHYLLIARRHLVRNKLISFINISGLSLGVAACLMMLSYVAHELTFDKFHAHADRIVLMSVKAKMGPDTADYPFMSYSTGPIVAKADPRVESFTRTYSPFSPVTLADPQRPDVKYKETQVLFADSSFFRFFSFHLRSGDPNTALNAPLAMVISRKAAHKYFGDTDPIGKTLQYDKKNVFRITGVAEDPPSNSSIQFDFVASVESLRAMGIQQVQSINSPANNINYGEFHTWLLLKDRNDKAGVQQVIQQVYLRLKDPARPPDHYYLVGLKDFHFNKNINDTSNSDYLVIFSLIATVVLLLALVNYMSLATAGSSVRGKEIAIRKIIGANAPAIRVQFYVESAIYSLIAFLLAFMLLVYFGRTIFENLGLSIDRAFIFSPLVISLFVLLFLVTTVIAGFYPSLVLSGLDPQAILGGRGFFKHNSATIRQLFTVLQFSLAVTLIIFCLTVNSQVHFFRRSDSGVARDNVVMIPVNDTVFNHLGSFRNEIAAIPGVRQTAIANYPLYGGSDYWPVSANHSGTASLQVITVDQNYIPLLGLRWKQQPADPFFYRQNSKMILNESAVSKFGFPPDAAGQSVQIGGVTRFDVPGVLNNFVFTDLKSTIEPLGIVVRPDSSLYQAGSGEARLFIKVQAGAHLPGLLASMKQVYAKYDNTTPFSFEFLDEVFNSRYKAEQRLEMILNICTPVIIFIACLGLFGLMYFNVNRKLKEISIRKVLGAERSAIVMLMCRNFLVLIGLSVAIACPAAWYVAHAWLQNFPYHIEAGWPIFAATIFGTLLISFVTILVQVWKAANTNPVNNLKL